MIPRPVHVVSWRSLAAASEVTWRFPVPQFSR